MTRIWPSLIGAAQVVQPETILRWHRAGFKIFWRWKSRNRAGRPKIDRGLRDLIRRMSRENALWGVARVTSAYPSRMLAFTLIPGHHGECWLKQLPESAPQDRRAG
jgi:hypothetical protein